MRRVKNSSSLCCRKVSFSFPENCKKNANLVEPRRTKIKQHTDSREPKTNGQIVEYESCCIDGFLIYSFTTAEEQKNFCPMTSLKVFPPTKHQVSIIPEPVKKIKNPEEKEIVFIDSKEACNSTKLLVKENQDVSITSQKNSCSSCGKVFVFLSSLEFHLRNVLSKNSVKLTCEFCSHISYGSATMRMHVRHLHGKRLYDRYSSDELKELFDEQIPVCSAP